MRGSICSKLEAAEDDTVVGEESLNWTNPSEFVGVAMPLPPLTEGGRGSCEKREREVQHGQRKGFLSFLALPFKFVRKSYLELLTVLYVASSVS